MSFLKNGVVTRELLLSLYLPALVLALGQGIIAPALPVYAKSFNIGFGEAALLFVSYQVGTLGATFPTGVMIDRIGRRPVLLAGPLLSALSSLLTVFAGSYPELLVYRFIAGAAQEFWMQSRMAIIADTTTAGQRGRQVTWMVGLQRGGVLLGPALGGLLAELFDVRAPFVAYTVLLVAILPAFIGVKETARPAKAATADKTTAAAPATAKPGGSLLAFILTTQILCFFAVQFNATISRGAQDSTFNLYAVYHYGVGPGDLGWMSLLAGIAALPIPFITGSWMDKWGRKRIIVPSFLLLALALSFVSATAFLQWSLELYVLGYVLAQMAQGTTNGTMQVLGADMSPREARGVFLGIWRFVSQGGALIAPAVFAFVAERVSYGAAFFMLAISAALVSVLVGFIMKETAMVGDQGAQPAPARAQAG